MKGQDEKKKQIISIFLYIVLVIGIMLFASFLQYRAYSENYNKKLNDICLMVQEKYPDISESELMEILNSDESSDTNFFEKYGIDIKSQSVILKNDDDFVKYEIVNGCIIFASIALLGVIFLIGNRKKEKRIVEITEYLHRINNGDYKFNMENEEEGSISILEGELYKTAIMLKESAENSRKDKEALKDSLSDISHQLKTPLTSLSINLENLEDNPKLDEEKRMRVIGHAKRDVNKVNQMVQMLLKLSRFDANVIEFSKQETKIFDLITAAAENVSALCDLKGIELYIEASSKNNEYSYSHGGEEINRNHDVDEVHEAVEVNEFCEAKEVHEVDEAHDVKKVHEVEEVHEADEMNEVHEVHQNAVLTCDPYWETEALTNIFKNGIEHAKTYIKVSYFSCEMYTEIVVENDGPTISNEDAKNIFTRFYRSSNATADSVGIGLSLADAIVHQDGGYIVVESDETKPDSGVRFIIRYV